MQAPQRCSRAADDARCVVSRWNTLVCVIAPASFHERFGHKHRSFINPEMTARPTATKGSSHGRHHLGVRCMAPRADVGGGDTDFRPSFHKLVECKALATEKPHRFSSTGQFLRCFIERQLVVDATEDSRAVLVMLQRVRNAARLLRSDDCGSADGQWHRCRLPTAHRPMNEATYFARKEMFEVLFLQRGDDFSLCAEEAS